LIGNSIDILIKNEPFTLLPQKAAYYKNEKALIVSDIHIGKTGHFRNAGIPVPGELAFTDLMQLDDLLSHPKLNVKKLIVLGDLFHSDFNVDFKIFEEWINKHNDMELNLVKGNHDILSDDYYEAINVKVFNYITTGKFLFVHAHNDKQSDNGLYKISGHMHPAVRIYGKAKQTLTLPCFYFGKDYAVLPAFGRFTGRFIINPCEDDFVFVITEHKGGKKIMKV